MSDLNPNPETRIALFQRKEIRKTIHDDEGESTRLFHQQNEISAMTATLAITLRTAEKGGFRLCRTEGPHGTTSGCEAFVVTPLGVVWRLYQRNSVGDCEVGQ